MNHIFIHCPFVQPIWAMFFQHQGLNWVFLEEIQDCFRSWYCNAKKLTIRNLWKFSFPHILWGIQKERNNRIFRNDVNPSKVVWAKIKHNFVENVMDRRDHDCNSKEDFDIIKCWNIPTHIDINTNQLKIRICCWSFPPNDYIKANFNGAAKGNPEPTGYGGVIQNCVGFCIGVVAFPLGNQTNHLAEAMGALQAIKLAHNLGVKFLVLQGDSKTLSIASLVRINPRELLKISLTRPRR